LFWIGLQNVIKETEAEFLEFRDWAFRFRPGAGTGSPLVVMLHGWTGDENSMWFFSHSLPEEVSIIAPRAPYKASEGGYSWRVIAPGTWGLHSFEDVRPSAERLIGFIEDWSKTGNLDTRQVSLIGFSQGAALAYAITALRPDWVFSLAALSGFIPRGTEDLLNSNTLNGKPVFISHGRSDDMVPIEKARTAVRLLEQSGAVVTYCESDGGHKVGKECMQGMKTFYKDRYGRSLSKSMVEEK
jgi:phospholipase/carboxylesterase